MIKRSMSLTLLLLALLSPSANAALNSTVPASVTFSPQTELNGYLSELISVIDSTDEQLEIALYGFEDHDVYDALSLASERGVEIRLLLEGAKEDRKESENTLSHLLEEHDIDVRYVNKIMHDKFLIADKTFLVTSSGNWNIYANSIYDENTVWITDEELVTRYRAEFEKLWQNARDFGKTFAFSQKGADPDSLLEQLVDLPARAAYFTSANYRTYLSKTYGPTFAKVSGRQIVASRLVSLIQQSTQSIQIAVSHFRSRPIAEALLTQKALYPNMDIRVYLDGQEYVSEGYNDIQLAKKEQCLANATTPAKIRDCQEKGFYYSYELIQAGIAVRFKTYSYKWHQNTASQMHHKYAIFDNQIVATGSYNYSYNAETNSMENLLVLGSVVFSEVVAAYRNNFESIWKTGREEGFYNDVLSYIHSETRYVPVLFPSMALEHNEVTHLRQIIREANPAVLEPFFKENREYFAFYPRGLEWIYDEDDRLISLRSAGVSSFDLDLIYNPQDLITEVELSTNDNLQLNQSYAYDADDKLTQISSKRYHINFAYDDSGYLSSVDAGQGLHTWRDEESDSISWSYYSTPDVANYITAQWNEQGLPILSTDADGREIRWQYDNNDRLTTVDTPSREIWYSADNDKNQTWGVETSDGESFSFQQVSINEIEVKIAGTVQADLHYTTTEQPAGNTLLNIGIVSGHVPSGKGKQAEVEYRFDPYGRVIQADDVTIVRQPYSGAIISITSGEIVETRSYNEWHELIKQRVNYQGNVYFSALYHYDGLHRIASVSEEIMGEVATYKYTYNDAGQLESVLKNGVTVERYTYDAFGNRTARFKLDRNEVYSYDNANRLLERTYVKSNRTRKAEYTYNNSGQLKYIGYKTIFPHRQRLTKERHYDYDVLGHLNRVTWRSQSQEYRYDPYDRLIAKIQNHRLKRRYVYGFGHFPLAELNKNGRIINVFLYASGSTPIVMRKRNASYYIVSDIRGSVRLVVKGKTGEVRQRIEYDTFGQVLEDSRPGYTPFGFAGGLYDYRTRLVRFGARDYNPEIGRWTAEDPIGFLSGDVNFYAYVGNDPVNFVDPEGLSRGGKDKKKSKCGHTRKSLRRPYLRKATRETIQAATKKSPDDKFIDKNTGEVISGKFHYGHIRGHEHWRLVEDAKDEGLSQKEFNDLINCHPEWFLIEDPISNMSHKFEMPRG